MLKIWFSIKDFIKGMIMGAVNVFPVSSGTASLILGVFERFVNAIKALNHKNFKFLNKGQFGEFARLHLVVFHRVDYCVGGVCDEAYREGEFQEHSVAFVGLCGFICLVRQVESLFKR